jgi:hypothetical protein
MAIQTINVGNLVNDGLGDDLRTAFQKVNNNFNVLTAELTVTGQNIGTAGVGIFKQKTNENLQLKKIAAGDSTVVIVDDTNTDTVKITAPLQNAFTSIIAGSSGPVDASSPTSSVALVAGDNVRITKAGQNITISADLLSGELLGNLDLNSYDIIGTGNIDISGTITADNFLGDVRGINIVPISAAVFDYDFGNIILGSYSSITEFLFAFGDYDFGSITLPNPIDLDLGTI